MTVHRPMRIILLLLAGFTAVVAALTLVLPDWAVTAIAITGFLGIMAGVFAWLWITDGEPPPPLSSQLQVYRREVIDTTSTIHH